MKNLHAVACALHLFASWGAVCSASEIYFSSLSGPSQNIYKPSQTNSSLEEFMSVTSKAGLGMVFSNMPANSAKAVLHRMTAFYAFDKDDNLARLGADQDIDLLRADILRRGSQNILIKTISSSILFSDQFSSYSQLQLKKFEVEIEGQVFELVDSIYMISDQPLARVGLMDNAYPPELMDILLANPEANLKITLSGVGADVDENQWTRGKHWEKSFDEFRSTDLARFLGLNACSDSLSK